MKINTEDLLSIPEYMRAVGCTHKTVYNRIASGKIPPAAVTVIGGKTFIIKDKLTK